MSCNSVILLLLIFNTLIRDIYFFMCCVLSTKCALNIFNVLLEQVHKTIPNDSRKLNSEN